VLSAAELSAYGARIGYAGAWAPSLAVLRDLQGRHPAAIAFESLDPFTGRPVLLEPEAVRQKLIFSRRGGYCHEHNLLFHDVLATLGLPVRPLGARVVWMDPERDAPLTHRLTLVDLPEGQFIADVGFGGQSPTAPLRLELGLAQPTAHGTFRLGVSDDVYELAMQIQGRWMPMYRFTLRAQSRMDFEMANWFTATHPRSRFTQNLVAARVVGATRVNLDNRDLTVRHADGHVLEERRIDDAADLGAVLDQVFDLEPPVPVAAIWSRLAGG